MSLLASPEPPPPARPRCHGSLSEASSRLVDVEGGVLTHELAAKLSPSIVLLVSFNGEVIHSQCAGIVIEHQRLGVSYLTSRDLVTTEDSRFDHSLKIKVHLPNGKVVNASVTDYTMDSNMLFVNTESFPCLQPAYFPPMQVDSSTQLLAASFCRTSGKFLVTAGVLTDSPAGLEIYAGTMWSTCKITETGSGGPLVDSAGNIVGMNQRMTEGITPFVPATQIVEHMYKLGLWQNIPARLNFSSKGYSSLYTIIGNSSQNGSSEGSENKNPDSCAVWCDLNQELASKLSPSIISLASFHGEALQSECTGIVIERNLSSASFLTTGSLFGSVDRNFWDQLTIKVRLPNDELVHGWLQYYSGPPSVAVVITHSLPPSLDLCVVYLGNDMQVESSAELLAVRRCFDSGKLVSTSGSLTGGIHEYERKLSTCKIIKATSGEPLVDCDGNIVGMNYYDGEITTFLQSNLILEFLGPDEGWAASKDPNHTVETQKSSTLHSDGPIEFTDDELSRILSPWRPDGSRNRINAMLVAKGYPLPKFADDGMYLKWFFEEGFGRGSWSKPTRRVASKMSQSVVALASFIVECEDSGEDIKEKKIARQFACTGVFIECNGSTTRILTSASLVTSFGAEKKLHPEWKIEVCLPSKRRVDGILEHYNLQYNVAVVSIEGVRSYRGAKLDGTSQTEVGAQVISLGRGFESSELMATNGALTSERCRFDCEELQMSTCKITKAGIGGPLVDLDGNFVGMNFFDIEQTPYLPRAVIVELVRRFSAERTVPGVVETPVKSKFPSWPVPDPEWFYPSRRIKLPRYTYSEYVLE
ncbi:unnamed protein product [Alopecurus aequalis]